MHGAAFERGEALQQETRAEATPADLVADRGFAGRQSHLLEAPSQVGVGQIVPFNFGLENGLGFSFPIDCWFGLGFSTSVWHHRVPMRATASL